MDVYSPGPGVAPPARHNTLFEIEEQRPGGRNARSSFAAEQRQDGSWSIQRWSSKAQQWVAENSSTWLAYARAAAQIVGPVAPEVVGGLGKLTESTGHDTAGGLMVAGGGAARALYDGKKAWTNYRTGEAPVLPQALTSAAGFMVAGAQLPWLPDAVGAGVEAGGIVVGAVGVGLGNHYENNKPQFTEPAWEMGTRLDSTNPAMTGMVGSPGSFTSPGQYAGSSDGYFPPVTRADTMPSIAATSGDYTTGTSYGASTVTAPAYTTSYSALPSLTAPSYSTAADYGASTTVTSRDPYYANQHDQQYGYQYDEQYDSRYDSGAGAGRYSPDIVRDPQYAEQHHGARPTTPTEHAPGMRFAR